MKRTWFKDARLKRHLTQAELAERVEKHQAYIAKLESGLIADPAFSVGLALASELGIDPYALRFGRKEEAA